LGADEINDAIVGAHPLQPADKHAKPGGVEELDPLHVHDQVIVPLVNEADKSLPQPGRGVDVNLAAHLDDGPARCGGILIKREIHGPSPFPCLGQ
jgi:hypothetical protein